MKTLKNIFFQKRGSTMLIVLGMFVFVSALGISLLIASFASVGLLKNKTLQHQSLLYVESAAQCISHIFETTDNDLVIYEYISKNTGPDKPFLTSKHTFRSYALNGLFDFDFDMHLDFYSKYVPPVASSDSAEGGSPPRPKITESIFAKVYLTEFNSSAQLGAGATVYIQFRQASQNNNNPNFEFVKFTSGLQ